MQPCIVSLVGLLSCATEKLRGENFVWVLTIWFIPSNVSAEFEHSKSITKNVSWVALLDDKHKKSDVSDIVDADHLLRYRVENNPCLTAIFGDSHCLCGAWNALISKPSNLAVGY